MVCYFFYFVRAQGAIECEHLKNNVTLDCEKTEEKLMHRYVCFTFYVLCICLVGDCNQPTCWSLCLWNSMAEMFYREYYLKQYE